MISAIKTIIQSMGLSWSYGNPSQINYYLQNTDYSASADGITAFCYLITESAYSNGKERATIAVFFSKLMPFDFNGDQAIQVIDDCKDKAKQFLNIVANGNMLSYTDARFQCGYDDYAENVGWCAVRATFEMMQADCVPWRDTDFNVVIPILEGMPIIADDIVIASVITTSDNIMDVVICLDGNVVTPNYISNFIIEYTQGYEEYQGHIGYLVELHDVQQGEHTLKAAVGGVESKTISFTIE